MSGAEAGFVVGLISSVISIIEATKTVYDIAKDAKGQPEAFRQVAARLPLIIEILHSAEERVQALAETAQEALKLILESCKAKAENLKKTFQKVIRKDDDKWYDRYRKALGTLREGDKVECLMEGILKDVQVLACERLTGAASDTQMKELEEAIKEMHEMPPSLPDEAGSFIQTHSGSGDNIGHTGLGTMNNHKGTGDLYHNVISGGATFGINSPNSAVNIINYHSQQHLSDLQTHNCLKDLRTTDPREDKKRIEETKGGLLADSYRWILEHSDFQQWRDDKQSRLLWIKGDPGKGKTMLLCGTVNEMSPLTRLKDKEATTLLSYFFCEATDSRINNATAVLRGLIYLLIDQQPSLVSHLREKYAHGFEKPFEGVNAWVALSMVFENILQDPSLKNIYLIVDALDECETDLPKLLNLVVQIASTFPRVKWIVSSRNKPDIEARLRLYNTQTIFSLELNSEHVSRAVQLFIDYKVSKLPLIMDNSTLQETLRGQVSAKASGTFLWAALALKELELVESWDVLDVLQEMPPELEPLYDRMLRQVQQLQRKDPEFCCLVLSTMTLAYRPLHLLEVGALSGLPEQISTNLDNVMRVVNKCGSFLTIRENRTYFIHQSAKDYFVCGKGSEILSSSLAVTHEMLARRCIQLMTRSLKRNISGLKHPGVLVNEVAISTIDQNIGRVQYPCQYWLRHLRAYNRSGGSSTGLNDSGYVDKFLRTHSLYWLETLGLMKKVSEGISDISKLLRILSERSPGLLAILVDLKRFALYNISIIEQAPLQVYNAAIIFSPELSWTKNHFRGEGPAWVKRWPKTVKRWGACVSILEGHSKQVLAVAFSPNGQFVASASDDKTVRLWDVQTGTLQNILEGHSDVVWTVVFTGDSRLVVSVSHNNTIWLWNTQTGTLRGILRDHFYSANHVAFSLDGLLIATAGRYAIRLWETEAGLLRSRLPDHSNFVNAMAFSPNGQVIASASTDSTVRLWETRTGLLQSTLEGHSALITAVVFSPDGQIIASALSDQTVMLWDTQTGALRSTLQGHSHFMNGVTFSPGGRLLPVVPGSYSNSINGVTFSPDGQLAASLADFRTVQVWDVQTGAVRHKLAGHSDSIRAVAFSPDGKLVVSASNDKTVRFWDVQKGTLQSKLEGHSEGVSAIAFSASGQLIASASYDKTVRLWDTQISALQNTLDGYSNRVLTMTISTNSQLVASVSNDKTVRLWDIQTGVLQSSLYGHVELVRTVAFSLDNLLVATASYDKIVWLWDVQTGALQNKLEGHSALINIVAFSPSGQLVASASYDRTVRIWKVQTGALQSTLKSLSGEVKTMAFSLDSQFIALATRDQKIRIWDSQTGTLQSTLEGLSGFVNTMAFSPNSLLIASASYDKTVRLWKVQTGALQNTFEGHSSGVLATVFSSDSRLLASASYDNTVRIWDTQLGVLRSTHECQACNSQLVFSTDGFYLKTNTGNINLRLPTQNIVSANPQSFDYALSEDGCWVTRGGHNVLWLPPDYRPTCNAVCGKLLVMGHSSGEITFIEFESGVAPFRKVSDL